MTDAEGALRVARLDYSTLHLERYTTGSQTVGLAEAFTDAMADAGDVLVRATVRYEEAVALQGTMRCPSVILIGLGGALAGAAVPAALERLRPRTSLSSVGRASSRRPPFLKDDENGEPPRRVTDPQATIDDDFGLGP